MLYERRANVRLIRLSGQQSALKRLEDHKILLYGIHNYDDSITMIQIVSTINLRQGSGYRPLPYSALP